MSRGSSRIQCTTRGHLQLGGHLGLCESLVTGISPFPGAGHSRRFCGLAHTPGSSGLGTAQVPDRRPQTRGDMGRLAGCAQGFKIKFKNANRNKIKHKVSLYGDGC